jgi:hypothetical protein
MSCLALLFVASTAFAKEQAPSTDNMQYRMAEFQVDHIKANVPPDAIFMKLLERDVRAHLVSNRLPSKNVKIELLRKGATQSGISFPKYYIWTHAVDVSGHHVEGAMRVAAIERIRFDITDFTLAASIRSDPAQLDAIYPALLIPIIRQHAEAK